MKVTSPWERWQRPGSFDERRGGGVAENLDGHDPLESTTAATCPQSAPPKQDPASSVFTEHLFTVPISSKSRICEEAPQHGSRAGHLKSAHSGRVRRQRCWTCWGAEQGSGTSRQRVSLGGGRLPRRQMQVSRECACERCLWSWNPGGDTRASCCKDPRTELRAGKSRGCVSKRGCCICWVLRFWSGKKIATQSLIQITELSSSIFRLNASGWASYMIEKLWGTRVRYPDS